MADPLICVIMPVHNAESWLGGALASLAGQTLGDYQIIAVDDGSTDGSGAILEQAAAQDGRLRVIHQDHRGTTAALNAALNEARGRYLARMDGDDLCEPDRLARQVEFLDAEPGVVAVGCGVLWIDPEGLLIAEHPYPTDHESIMQRMVRGLSGLPHPGAMIRAEAMRRVGGYDTSYTTAQDFDLWLRLAEMGRLANLPQILLRYRLHLHGVGARRRAEQQDAVRRALAAHAQRIGKTIPPPQSRSPRTASALQATWAQRAWRAGHAATARKHAGAVLKRQPWRWRLWPIMLGRGAS